MSKELEALKIGIPKLKKLYENSAKKINKNDILGFDLVFVYLDKALQRLESIENSKPSEALDCLEKLGAEKLARGELIRNDSKVEPYINTIKQALLKAQEQEKVLDVIKEKKININNFQTSLIVMSNFTYTYYINNSRDYHTCILVNLLTEEEFDLLKRWLEND